MGLMEVDCRSSKKGQTGSRRQRQFVRQVGRRSLHDDGAPQDRPSKDMWGRAPPRPEPALTLAQPRPARGWGADKISGPAKVQKINQPRLFRCPEHLKVQHPETQQALHTTSTSARSPQPRTLDRLSTAYRPTAPRSHRRPPAPAWLRPPAQPRRRHEVLAWIRVEAPAARRSPPTTPRAGPGGSRGSSHDTRALPMAPLVDYGGPYNVYISCAPAAPGTHPRSPCPVSRTASPPPRLPTSLPPCTRMAWLTRVL